MLVEAALIKLGTAAVRTAAKLWLGDQKIAAEVSASAVDFMSERLVSVRDKRKFNRMIDSFAEEVVNRVEPILEREFRGLPENERLAAIEAVTDTFALASLADRDLFAADLDAGHLDRSIRARVPSQTRLLSASGTALYDLLLRECCGYVIEIARGLPQFSTNALTELLRRDREILDGIRDVLARLPQRDRKSGFDYDYRQLVARKLDEVQVYGVTLSDASRKYPLSVAYISLTAATERDDVFEESRIEELLAVSDRVFIRGEAGLGKTTLLHWMAVRSALSDFHDPLLPWNGTVPFFLPLRRYSDGNLPAPEKFLEEIGRHIADEMSHGWVHDRLRDGTAVLLIDGVDEVVAEQRDAVRSWLSDLVASFPQAKFVITSRPGAAPSEWLREDQFAVVDLQPMTLRDVRIFVNRWHDAMRSMTVDADAQAEITKYERGLIQHLDSRAHIRKLARYPLLCALLCALHKDRRAALPSNRMELYDVALQMMLERRDAERKISDTTGLNRTEKVLLLGDLAYWLIRNGHSDTEAGRAKDRFGSRLRSMPQVTITAAEVYRHLLERSGLLREPVEGRVDFVHRTFQEYLAAQAAMNDADDVGTVVENAHLDQWHEVVVMAVGCASRMQRDELFSKLLERHTADVAQRDALDLLALASLETAPELRTSLRNEIEKRASRLLPPKTMTVAKSFASAGPFVLDLLAKANPRSLKQTVTTVRAIAGTGLPEAIPLLAQYRDDQREGVRDELVRAWEIFDPEDYAKQVIPGASINDLAVVANSPKFRSLQHLGSITELHVFSDRGSRIDLKRLPKNVGKLTIKPTDEVFEGRSVPVDLAPLAQVTDLHWLDIRWPVIENLTAIAALPRLFELTISSTEIRPGLPLPAGRIQVYTATLKEIGDLTSLAPLGFMQGLRILTLDGISALYDLMGVDQWHNLEYLSVVNSPVVDVSALTDLHSLTELSLCATYIENVSVLRNLRRLTRLDLSHTSVTDIFPLAGLTDLQFLDLTGTRVSDISPLRKLTALQEIQLADSQIHDLSPLGPGAEIVRGPTSEPVSVLNPFATN